ncbi:hypothetical protein [Vibrio alginolyticus]|uniref:hypothetical protein n=1 Tax=Vibrio alginolyticus TaxID=663 RepID=UPI001BD6BF4E|nr:hypothetical protein [Vibrio alginolyticus]MBE4476306.1 hypothetical protein [Vibrio parahaemolyticus]MBT0082751.1 hypothetical protein [Vibrio alginolyticus]MBT0106034.1 hypothetical protein [Vibrio alginolyticus]
MESSFTQKYTMMLTVMVAVTTAFLASFLIVQKEIKPQTDELVRIERVEKLVNELESTLSLQKQVLELKEENKRLAEMVAFYKEKNEFLTKQLSDASGN